MESICNHEQADLFCMSHNEFICMQCCAEGQRHSQCRWDQTQNLSHEMLEAIQEFKNKLGNQETGKELHEKIEIIRREVSLYDTELQN